MYVKFLLVEAVICDPMSQREPPAPVEGAGSQTRFEERDRASQITARLIRNGQAHHAMRVDFPARFFNCLARTTTNTQGRFIFRPAAGCQLPRSLCSVTPPTCLMCSVSSTVAKPEHASLAQNVSPSVTASRAQALRSASSHRCNESSAFLPSRSAQRFLLGGALFTSPCALSSAQAEVLY